MISNFKEMSLFIDCFHIILREFSVYYIKKYEVNACRETTAVQLTFLTLLLHSSCVLSAIGSFAPNNLSLTFFWLKIQLGKKSFVPEAALTFCRG